MGNTLTIRLPEDLAEWLEQCARRSGLPRGQIVRQQLERARAEGNSQAFLRHAGAFKGGRRDVSSRKGFSRS